jgi:hypothetical protein
MSDPLGSIYDWDEDGVCLFFSNLGYPQFDESIRGEHGWLHPQVRGLDGICR